MSLQSFLLFLVGTLLPSFLVSGGVAFFMRYYAPRWGLIDQPGERKVHVSPTPLGGGVAIWAGIVLPFAVGQLTLLLLDWDLLPATWVPLFVQPHLLGIAQQTPKLWLIFLAATVLLVLGLLDDLHQLSWQLRLGTQTLVALVCIVLIDDMRLTLFIHLPLLTGACSVLWIVALINSFNMLDNMDGLSAGVAAIAAGLLAVILLTAPDPTTQQPQLFVAGLLLVMLGSLLGFLGHNCPPAKIFMGDGGSYVIGFLIATATLLATYAGYRSEHRHAILAPLCVLAVPLYDMGTVVAIRLARGKSPFVGDKNHFSHRLVDLGLTKTQAVHTIYLLTATCGLGGLLLHQVDAFGAVLILALIFCVLCVIAIIETAARGRVTR